MERRSSDRSAEVALQLDQVTVLAKPKVWAAPHTPSETHESASTEADALQTVRSAYDKHLRHLARLRAGLRQAPIPSEEVKTRECAPITLAPQRPLKAHAQPPLLHGTLVYLDKLQHPPLLPAPCTVTFEDAFKRHEPMFHTVFYRKYPPWVLDDAKQEALLALYRKWLKNKSILEQSSSYVVQAAIYGFSNWRQKGMKVRGREAQLVVDNHGKVAGEPQRNFNDRWTDRIDLRLDVTQAVEAVLCQHEQEPEYREIYRAMQDLQRDIPFKQARQASGLSFRTYKKQREQVKADLRFQLEEYRLQRRPDLNDKSQNSVR